jgi:hypothetical protein
MSLHPPPGRADRHDAVDGFERASARYGLQYPSVGIEAHPRSSAMARAVTPMMTRSPGFVSRTAAVGETVHPGMRTSEIRSKALLNWDTQSHSTTHLRRVFPSRVASL